jgi:hypothetical protein
VRTEIPSTEADARDTLIERLRAAGVRYLGGGHDSLPYPPPCVEPVETLILGLAQSRDPRLRTALVALLLHKPEIAPRATRLAYGLIDRQLAQYLDVCVLAAAALQRTWAFSLDIYTPGWLPINVDPLAHSSGVALPSEDYGRATLLALDRLLAADDPLPPDYYGAWEDVGRHVLDDLREVFATYGA